MSARLGYALHMRRSGTWTEGFIAVDWGTTNRRAYRLEGGRRVDEFEDGAGILSVGQGGFEAAVDEVRERLKCRPLLLAGMIGSNRGWIEAPYVPCPAGLDEIAAELVDASDQALIVPGVALTGDRFDVMRGEEVQIVGAVQSGAIPRDCLVCHPGTHAKWVQVADGRIASFLTVMTGELFSLLRQRSILSDLLQGTAEAGEAFRAGARAGVSGAGVTAQLFEARARSILGALDPSDGASYVSGLLIGEGVRAGLANCGDGAVYVMGRAELTELYAVAIGDRGIETRRVDGDEAFVAGAKAIAERI